MFRRDLRFGPAATVPTPALVQDPVRHLHRDRGQLDPLMRMVRLEQGQRHVPTRTPLRPEIVHRCRWQQHLAMAWMAWFSTRVVFQKWRWTEIAVTLGLVFVASLRKEWPMTFIAVRCPHCQSDQIIKRGKTARGTQRYLCQNTL